MSKQWLNDISRDLNSKIYEHRKRPRPSVVLRYKWHEEFIAQGLDKKQSFQSYLKFKTRQWYKSKKK